MALFVDELLGQQQVVIKNLETNFRKVPGVAGATILGDGRVALILDTFGVSNLGQDEAASSRQIVASTSTECLATQN
jgi:two-component system chemotaxis sensor kinase CheA